MLRPEQFHEHPPGMGRVTMIRQVREQDGRLLRPEVGDRPLALDGPNPAQEFDPPQRDGIVTGPWL